ncbi:hypothetical protein HDU98_006143 [Podochytrium sp. JEL0797]|nr:hypothetical protein HDU98_006143 [Podochytrium sp. JEL0797]
MEYEEWQVTLNLLFVLYALPNTVLPFYGGKFTEIVGSQRMLLACCLMSAVGQIMVNVGLVGGNMFLALLGRFIFGAGAETCSVAQAVLMASWFEGKNLLLATAMNAFFSKLGAVANSIISPLLDHYFGVEIAILGATIACLISLLASIILYKLTGNMAHPALTQPAANTEMTPLITQARAEMICGSPTDIESVQSVETATISHLPVSFWIVCGTFVSFRAVLYCFNNTALDFLMTKWYTNDTVTAGLAMSIPMITSTVLLAVCGAILTSNTAGYLVEFLSMILFTLIHLTLGFSTLSPTIPLALIGLVAAINLTLMFPFINHCTKRQESKILEETGVQVNVVGLAYGVAVCCQNVSLTVIPMCVALILTMGWGG